MGIIKIKRQEYRFMAFLRLQRRLAATVLKCGKNRVWIDPNECSEVALANSRKNIRKLYKDGLIMKRQVQMHSRSRVKRVHEANRKYRQAKKITSDIYHHFYIAAKANQFKNKSVLI